VSCNCTHEYTRWEASKCVCPCFDAEACFANRYPRPLDEIGEELDDRERCQCGCHPVPCDECDDQD